MPARKRTSERTKPASKIASPTVLLRFTGDAGGTHYVVDGKIHLRKGGTILVPLEGHWVALVASGDASIVEE